MQIWTQNITTTFTFTRDMGFFRACVVASGGSIFVTGGLTIPDPDNPGSTLPSQPIEVLEGASHFFDAGPTSPLEDILINANGNIAQLECFYG